MEVPVFNIERLEELHIESDLSTEELKTSVDNIFEKWDLKIIREHTTKVMSYIEALANHYKIDVEKAKIAALLHDISGIIPNNQRINYCQSTGISLINEELELPILTHQKISKDIAFKVFHVNDPEILSAIACHTTLKVNAGPLDLLLFITDKIKWDQQGEPPYLELVLEALEVSLKNGVLVYMKYMLDHQLLKLIHPDFQRGYEWLLLEQKSMKG